MKNIYEVFDDFELAGNKQDRMQVIEKNLSQILVDVLKYTYDPRYQWYFTEVPEGYQIKHIPAGMGYTHLSTELRKIYMFQKGHSTADKLTQARRKELLLQMLENLEPREAEVVIGIFNKDQGVRGLNSKFVKEAFPSLIQ